MDYKYVVLRHQALLQSSERENFAILVEGRGPNGGAVIFAVGRAPALQSHVSEVGLEVVRKFPQILENLVREALREKKPTENVLDWLHSGISWNFQASEPQVLTDTDPIHQVAFKLFSEKVAGADQLLENLQKASQRMTRPSDMNQRLGEIFQAGLSVPEPELALM
jgi:hypothetical protein